MTKITTTGTVKEIRPIQQTKANEIPVREVIIVNSDGTEVRASAGVSLFRKLDKIKITDLITVEGKLKGSNIPFANNYILTSIHRL